MKTTSLKSKPANTPDSGLQNRNEQSRTSIGAASQPIAPDSAPCKPVQSEAQNPWRGVFFAGPAPDRNRDGDEIPVWTVYVGDDEGIPLGSVYRVYSFAKAEALAHAMATDRNLELIADAMPADAKPQVAEPVAA